MSWLKKIRINYFLIAGLFCLFVISFIAGDRTSAQSDYDIYIDDAPSNSWEDWSWDTTVAFNNTSPVQSGTTSISLEHTAGLSALFLHIPNGGSPIALDEYEVVKFWIHGGTTGGQSVFLGLVDSAEVWSSSITITPAAGEWTYYEVAISDFDFVEDMAGVVFQNGTADVQPVYYLDNVQLGFASPVPTATPLPPTPPANDTLSLTIDTNQDVYPISPYIYGSNQPLDGVENLPARRMGGNRTTAYNWENNASNAGADWYHTSDAYLCQGISSTNCDTVPGIVYTTWHEDSIAQGAYSLATLQMAGYVAKDKAGEVLESEAAPSSRWDAVDFTKGAPFSLTPDLTDNVVYMDEFVNMLVSTFGSASSPTGIQGYSLDNEPALWSHTHARIHPNPVTYAELVSRSVELATAVKAIDPDAEIFGPSLYGFYAYVTLQDAPDRSTEGVGYDWFISYYLDKMNQAEQTSGQRLLDVLDIHWYPEAQGDGVRITTNDAGSQGTQEARMQAPRSLWDPTYLETSWIADSAPQYLPILPPVQESIDTYYPGTKLAITEFSYGGGNHISGGIAAADALGVFGRYNVYLATQWRLGTQEPFIGAAYNLYLDYDGMGSTYGDTHVQANTSDIDNSSVYAALDDNNNLHIIVLNKSYTSSYDTSFTINSGSNYTSGNVWGFNQYALVILDVGDVSVISGNTFNYTVPPLSAYHFVLQADGTTPTNTPVPTSTATPTGATPTATATNTPVTPTDVPTNTPTTPTSTSTPLPGGVCVVDYVVSNSWGNNFQANVTITNNSASTISGWTLEFTHAPGQTVTGGWNATLSQSGNDVTVSNPASYWNGVINANGGAVTFGLQGTFTGSVVIPTDFSLNGTACNDGAEPTPTSVPPTATSVPPTVTSVPPTVTSVPLTATSVPPTATAVPPTSTPSSGMSCSVIYDNNNDWGSGFTANVTISNDGTAAINGWTLAFTFPGNQQITNLWSGGVTQNGAEVLVDNVDYNSTINPGSSVSFGFQASYSGSNDNPTTFVLNGESCN